MGRLLWPVMLILGTLAAGCGNPEVTGTRALTLVGPGILNNPANKSLRFDLLKFGLERFCFEMMSRGVALKTKDDEPVVGRFFADQCQSRALDDSARKTLVVQFSGRGYVWSNLTARIGFQAKGVVEYAPDFLMHEESLYIYFRPQQVDAVSFETKLVESVIAQGGIALTGANPNQIGEQIVTGQLRRGFTVIRLNDSGAMEFGLGFIPRGQHPFQPFRVRSDERVTLANDRTVVQLGQQDFIGGFKVEEEGQALYLTLKLDGTPAVDVLVVPKSIGDVMIQSYVSNAGPTVPTSPPILLEPLPMGQLWQRYVPVRLGDYYVVIDHSAAIAPSAPPTDSGQALPGKVDYAIQLGAAP